MLLHPRRHPTFLCASLRRCNPCHEQDGGLAFSVGAGMTAQSQTIRALCLSVIALTAAATSLVAQPALIPLPQLVVTNAGTFVLCPPQAIRGVPEVAPTKILVDDPARTAGEYLALTLFKSTGYRFEVATNSGS